MTYQKKRDRLPVLDGRYYDIGDTVHKRSRKPFQNGKRLGTIESFTSMQIPGKGEEEAVFLTNCDSPVTIMTIQRDEDEIKLLGDRDVCSD